jgi:hypothetical protein
MVYRPPFLKQLDGSTFAGTNCLMASTAMAIIRDRRGVNPPGTAQWYPTPRYLRYLSGDRSGGTNLAQASLLAQRYYGVSLQVRYRYSWTDFRNRLKEGRGVILQGQYDAWSRTKWDGSGTFRGGHGVYVNEVRYNKTYSRYEYLVYDPLWDGRRSGILKGPQWMPEYYLKKFAGALIVAGRRIGLGLTYCAYTRDTESASAFATVGGTTTTTTTTQTVKLRTDFKATAHTATYYSRYEGARVRTSPRAGASVAYLLPKNYFFKARQKTTIGDSISGSRTWYGDWSGTRWVVSGNLSSTRT